VRILSPATVLPKAKQLQDCFFVLKLKLLVKKGKLNKYKIKK